ncbi:hypothetical protein LTR53_012172 [Teratosphaeriaceae sp. CCFEE 6253]|nr:hypothetical protein LTR53_012172 [Teratosphaeriaceae sp. CCFEE 6253]
MSGAAAPQANGTSQHPAFVDPAFDAQDGFDFDDINEEILRGMQDGESPLNVFHHGFGAVAHLGGQDANPLDPRSADHRMYAAAGAYSSMNPAEMYGGGLVDAFTSSKPQAAFGPTPQSEIINGRSDSVVEKYGHITPPDQTPTEQDDRKKVPRSSRSGKESKLDKSERARNAANSRHAKSKQARAQSGSAKSADGSEDGEEGVEGKREKYREKNRVAAAKCRAKRKDSVDILEERHRQLSADNNFLRRTERALRDEYSMLRTIALQHTPAISECKCAVLHGYNAQKANQVAYGLGGPSVLSPSEGYYSPSMAAGTSRTSSMSGAPLTQTVGQLQGISSGGEVGSLPVSALNSTMSPLLAINGGAQQAFSSYLQSSAEHGGFGN